jgi:hypothetical protein
MCRWRRGRSSDMVPTMSRIAELTDALIFARQYTVELLDTIPSSDWFTMPTGCPSHVAWQVGHLASAEAWLIFGRACGRLAEIESIRPARLATLFGRTSTPEPDPAKYPSPEEIRKMFDQIHGASLAALRDLQDSDLDEISAGPHHRLCRTKGEFLRWCGYHEMSHAGQIGLIRRMLGATPVW